jgi:outer membrane protein Omp28/type IX secretion system substrate protein
MKKIYFALTALIISAFTMQAQQVDRDMVMLEIVTGTWCQYCPGAAMGADDLIANGHDVAVVEYHGGDDYENTFSTSRISYYGISSYPTAKFDGLLTVSGGSSTQSMYAQYLPRYNQRHVIQSSFSIDAEGLTFGLIDYEATITVEKVATTTASNLKLQFVITESDIEENWQGLHELHFVERTMVPNQNGTSVDFTSGNSQVVNLDFSIDESWVYEHCEIVVFLQDNSTKEIHQAIKLPLSDFAPAYDRDASVNEATNVPVKNCSGTVAPIATIRNNGNATLTSLDINYLVNGGDVYTHNWTGELNFLETANVELPSIDFTLIADNELEIFSSMPNGEEDEYPDNDALNTDFTMAEHTLTTVNMMLRLDSHPEETSWELSNDEGTVLYSGDNYTTPNQNVMETFTLVDDPGCYTFSIFDSLGDGLALPGFYMLYYGNNVIIFQGSNCGYQKSIQFTADDFVTVEDHAGIENINIYPNPFRNSTNVAFSILESANIHFEILNTLGQLVFQSQKNLYQPGIYTETITPGNLSSGIYFIRIYAGEKNISKKITIIN